MITRVAIVEDDPEICQALKKIVDSSEDLLCIATFDDAESLTARFIDLNTDVVLMDINLPGNNGIQTVAKLKPRRPEVQFMMCTIFNDSDKIFDSLCAGATGYILKSEEPAEIINAIKEISNGGSPMSAQIARCVVQSFQQRKNNTEAIDQLSNREWELLNLLDKGFRYKEIADQLSLSFETIRTYIRNIYDKLQVHSRTDALNKVFPKN
jgi:NarL family two-component system response regulator LiaR